MAVNARPSRGRQGGHTMQTKDVKARKYYVDVVAEQCGNPAILYVTGFADVNGEKWCRYSDRKGETAKMLVHPERLRPIS